MVQQLHLFPSLGFASGKQACKIMQQLISYWELNKWWVGQFIQQEKKRNPTKFPVVPGSLTYIMS
jgi:hypothetical protein